jgi:hypothetical protein
VRVTAPAAEVLSKPDLQSLYLGDARAQTGAS